MADQVRINGNAHSWGSIIAKVGGERFYGFNSVSFGDKRERVKGYGMGRHHAPRSRSAGKYSTDPVKLGGPKSSMQALRAKLAALSLDGISYGNVEFELTIQYVEPTTTIPGGETPIQVDIHRCVITANSTSDEESADPLKEEVEIDCMAIRRNGLTLFDSSQGSP
jgi:hypothetical protein